jgi:hypothetical protein
LTTTISRYAFTDDTGDGESGDVLNAALIATAFYDPIDALLANPLTLGSIVSATSQPRSVVYNSATQSLPNNTLTAVTFDTEDFDVGSMHSTSVNTSRMTCPANGTGAYLAIGKVPYAGSAGGTARVARLRKNGSDIGTQGNLGPVAATTQVVHTMAIFGMVPGDYVELYGFQDSGGALNIGDGATRAIQSELTVIKLW